MVWWSCFIPRTKKKSCSVDVLKFWKYNFLLVLLVDALTSGCCEGMARQRENRESREGFLLPEYSGKGHTKRGGYQTASIMWESDKVRWQMRWYPGREQKIGDESSVRYKISLPEIKLPSPRTNPSSSASPGLNRRAHWAVSAIVSLASHPFLCIPELDTIQWMKNSTIMNQNKRALSHLVFFSLFPPNANDCVCSC